MSPNKSAKKSFQNIKMNYILKFKHRFGKIPAGNKCFH